MKIKIIFLLTAISFSCGRLTESPIISEPQPDNGFELKKIPKKLIGTYKSLVDSVDSTYLIVTDKKIIIKSFRNPNVSIAELDSTEIRNLKDTVYQVGNDSMTVRVTADSVFQRIVHFDTLFYSSYKYLIKKSKGYYFCNQTFRDKWLVRTLRITDNGILISKLRSKEEIMGLMDYTSREADSIVYDIPDGEEIRKYLTDEEFKDELMFVRIEYGNKI